MIKSNAFNRIFRDHRMTKEANGFVWGNKVTVSYVVRPNGLATLEMKGFYIKHPLNRKVISAFRSVTQVVSVPTDSDGLDKLGACFQEIAPWDEDFPIVHLNGERSKLINSPEETWHLLWEDALSRNFIDSTGRFTRRIGRVYTRPRFGQVVETLIPFEWGNEIYNLMAQYAYYDSSYRDNHVNNLVFLGFDLSDQERTRGHVCTIMP